MTSFPIDLNVKGRTVLVVGLGAVGRRKARSLAAAGAQVVGVDPAVAQADFVEAPIEGLEVVSREYQSEDLAGKSLAVAAGPAEVNRRVVEDSRKIGVWVCSATESESGDFTLPALWRSGPLTLTVSTSGASPALAASLRDRAVAALGPSAAGFAGILFKLRPIVLAQVADPAKRAEIFRDWGDPRWLALYEKEGMETVEEQLRQRLDPELS